MKRLSRRDMALEEIGPEQVYRVEEIVRQTVLALLASPLLKSEGIRRSPRSIVPPIEIAWRTGMSHGGAQGITFAVLAHARKHPLMAEYREYKSLAADPMIGNHRGTRDQCLQVLVAHELAHWLQYSRQVARPPGLYRTPHGSGFRKLYWILRYILRQEWNASQAVTC